MNVCNFCFVDSVFSRFQTFRRSHQINRNLLKHQWTLREFSLRRFHNQIRCVDGYEQHELLINMKMSNIKRQYKPHKSTSNDCITANASRCAEGEGSWNFE